MLCGCIVILRYLHSEVTKKGFSTLATIDTVLLCVYGSSTTSDELIPCIQALVRNTSHITKDDHFTYVATGNHQPHHWVSSNILCESGWTTLAAWRAMLVLSALTEISVFRFLFPSRTRGGVRAEPETHIDVRLTITAYCAVPVLYTSEARILYRTST